MTNHGMAQALPKGTPMTDEEIAQRVEDVIDFCEDTAMPLEPWQAHALRAILLAGKPSRVITAMPPQHPQRDGYRSDHVIVDEMRCPCNGLAPLEYEWTCGTCGVTHTPVDPGQPLREGMRRMLIDGEWVWV
jgi:hypothetical protein